MPAVEWREGECVARRVPLERDACAVDHEEQEMEDTIRSIW